MPTVSIVIPVKNDAALLERCLAALRAQSVAPREVIVVDNGSTDRSVLVAAESGARVLRDLRPGIAAAAATGYDAASGEIIARCDADSVPPVDWVERIVAAFDDASLDALTGPGEFPELSPTGRWFAQTFYMNAYFGLVGLLLAQPPLFGSNAAMRSQLWRRSRDWVHIDDQNVHDDFDLSVQFGVEAAVRLDRTLAVPVSSRPFTGLGSMIQRGYRGWHTVWVNRGRLRPLRRRFARRRAARAAAAVNR